MRLLLFFAALVVAFLALLGLGLYTHYRTNIAPPGRRSYGGGGDPSYAAGLSHSAYDGGPSTGDSGWGGVGGGGGPWDSPSSSWGDSGSSSSSDSGSSSSSE